MGCDSLNRSEESRGDFVVEARISLISMTAGPWSRVEADGPGKAL